jgi:SAM-dependent methyltransferase
MRDTISDRRPDVQEAFDDLATVENSAAFRVVHRLTPEDLDRQHIEFALVDAETNRPVHSMRRYYLPTRQFEYPAPPHDNQKRVMGWARDDKYQLLGNTHAMYVKRIFEKVCNGDRANARDMLDFGCGPGRVGACITSFHRDLRYTGVDIDWPNIQWAIANIGRRSESRSRFFTSNLEPPLPFADKSFDLVYSNSVFTHLHEIGQFEWLEELARVSRPGAVLVLTTHGPTYLAYAYRRCGIDFINRTIEAGFTDLGRNRDLDTVFGENDFYINTVHSLEYVRSKWTLDGQFEIAHVEEGLFGYQDAIVLLRS